MAEENNRQLRKERRKERRMEQPKRNRRGGKRKEDSGNFMDSVESAIGKAAVRTNPAYLMAKPAIDTAQMITENPEAARRVARKVGGATQRGLETASKFTPPALAARLFDTISEFTPPAVASKILERFLGDEEQEEAVSRSKGDRQKRRNKKIDSLNESILETAKERSPDMFEEPLSPQEMDNLNESIFKTAKERSPDMFEGPEKIDFVEEDEPSGDPLIGVEDIDVSEPMLRAEPVPEMDEKESGRLFKMIMGSSFDPLSSMDKGKMETLKKAKAENPGLSDNQLALKIYRDYM